MTVFELFRQLRRWTSSVAVFFDRAGKQPESKACNIARAILRAFIDEVDLGYRADVFFGAMDGGIETRKSENVGFYGPFASVSVGIGG